MENRKGSAEEFFRHTGKKIDDLIVEIRNQDFAKQIELEERLRELRRNKESLEKDFSKFKEDNKTVFQDIVNSFEESILDIKKAFQKATTKSN